MRLEVITLDLHMKGYEVIPILLRIEQEVSPHVLTMMKGHGGEYPCSLWNDVEASTHIIWWGWGGEYPQSKSKYGKRRIAISLYELGIEANPHVFKSKYD